MAQSNCHAGCSQVIKEVASKSLELSIIVNQKTTEMVKTINEANTQTMAGIKARKVSVELPDLMMDLHRENGELNHVNAVLGNEIGKLIRNNPKCFN